MTASCGIQLIVNQSAAYPKIIESHSSTVLAVRPSAKSPATPAFVRRLVRPRQLRNRRSIETRENRVETLERIARTPLDQKLHRLGQHCPKEIGRASCRERR